MKGPSNPQRSSDCSLEAISVPYFIGLPKNLNCYLHYYQSSAFKAPKLSYLEDLTLRMNYYKLSLIYSKQH